MRSKVNFLLLGISTMIFYSCEKENTETDPSDDPINKIMPLGASRVEGSRPQFESYRYELWKKLIENDREFDLIGTRTDKASYPSFESKEFDADHEGRGGWTSGEILAGLEDRLDQTGEPDIVLFSSPGANDALQELPYNETISNINEIIDTLQSDNPEVTILIEQMAPGHSDFMTPKLTDYFNKLQQDVVSIASAHSSSSSDVIPVDMFTGFKDSLLADVVHYNEAGAEFIASRYYDVLEDELEDQ